MFSSEKTVKLLIRRRVNQIEQILLVHERGDTARGGKPAGWGLPGGGIKSHEKDIFNQIKNLLASQVRFPKENGGDRPASNSEYERYFEMFLDFPPVSQIKVVLTAVKEAIEETGLFIKPVREIFREETLNSGGHEVVLVDCEIITGLLSKHSLETDDINWFEVGSLPKGNLPQGIYQSDLRRIARAMEILRQPEQEQYTEEESIYE